MLMTARITFATVWAAALTLVGAWTWLHPAESMRLIGVDSMQFGELVIAGQFVFVVLVADIVMPNGRPGVRTFFKTMFGAAFYLSLAWMTFLVVEVVR